MSGNGEEITGRRRQRLAAVLYPGSTRPAEACNRIVMQRGAGSLTCLFLGARVCVTPAVVLFGAR